MLYCPQFLMYSCGISKVKSIPVLMRRAIFQAKCYMDLIFPFAYHVVIWFKYSLF